MGVMVPTMVDADTGRASFDIAPKSQGSDTGYLIMEGPDHIPEEASCGFPGCVVNGYSRSEYDMYQSVIYQNTTHQGRISLPEEGLGNKWVNVDIAGTGPILLRVNYPDLDVEDDT